MADVTLAVQDIVKTGLAAVYTGSLSTANTYKFANDGRTILHFKKSAAVICTVTLPTPGTVDGLAITDRTVAVPATTGDKFIGKLSKDVYNDANGYASFTLSDVDGLTVAVLKA
jgi:hypothetical protein